MKGRKPLPDEQKKLKGTLRKSRVNKNKPEPARVATSAGPYKLNARAQLAWDELAPQLEKSRVLTEGDLQWLKLLCEAIAEYDSLYNRLWIKQANGQVEYEPIKNFYQIYEKGSKKKLAFPTLIATKLKPEVALIAENRKFQKSLLAEFGLTPSSRAKVTAGLPPGAPAGETQLEKMRRQRAERKAKKNNTS